MHHEKKFVINIFSIDSIYDIVSEAFLYGRQRGHVLTV